nr:immunoglobulin heavy chain junction region [Mus musculus]NSM05625.1 immunoglobulin heavy chain junction region [Mus musculus]
CARSEGYYWYFDIW